MEEEKKMKKREDGTKYGEFVCSTYHWLPVEKQKDRANELNKATKKTKK